VLQHHPVHARRVVIVAIWWVATSVAATVLVTLAGCGGGAKAPDGETKLIVTAHAPNQHNVDPSPTIMIQFDKPAVAEIEVGADILDMPIAISPAIDSNAHWLDRQTLIINPITELTASTRYTVELLGELAIRTNAFSFSFVNQPLQLEGIWGVPLDRLPTRPALPLHFNQPVAAAEVIRHCQLHPLGGGDPIPLVTSDMEKIGEKIVVRPVSPLAQGQRFRLVCQGLRAIVGDVEMSEAFSIELETSAALSVMATMGGSPAYTTD